MIVYERRRGIRSSGLMIVLWIALVVYGALKLFTVALEAQETVS